MNKTRNNASANEKLKCICAETQLKVAKLELEYRTKTNKKKLAF